MTKVIKFEEYELSLYKLEYQNNQGLAILALMEDGEEYATLTVNLGGIKQPNWQYFNVNIYQGEKLYQLLLDEKIIAPLGFSATSGFVSYPLVRWNLDEILELDE